MTRTVGIDYGKIKLFSSQDGDDMDKLYGKLELILEKFGYPELDEKIDWNKVGGGHSSEDEDEDEDVDNEEEEELREQEAELASPSVLGTGSKPAPWLRKKKEKVGQLG